MIKFEKLYRYPEVDDMKIYKISQELNISTITARVLLNRGLDTSKKCKEFLDPRLEELNDPYLMKDMDVAVDRIIKAIEYDENIYIYGDYDGDGITSVSILKMFFNKINKNCNYYIPNRLEEGYGLNKYAIDSIKGNCDLLITVDCGISNLEEVEYLNENNVDVIITDHHQCESLLPNSLAVLNPNREDCNYPFKKLAGVGVVFKLVQALSMKLNVELDYSEILPIVAIGTITDVVPLISENRIIVKNGLDAMKENKNLGLRALIETCGLKDKNVNSYHIGFVIGPRLNAAGRLNSANLGVELFLSESYDKAVEYAQILEKENAERQDIENAIFEEAEEMIEKFINLDDSKVIVLASEKWHSGVIGIVASKIVEKYFRPTILFSIDGEFARGSARSIPGFNIYEGLKECSNLLEGFGGHKQAAGMQIKTELISDFRKKFNDVVKKQLSEEDFIPEVIIDGEILSKDITLNTANELNSLEPFGMGNPSPQFLYKEAKVIELKQVGKDGKHLKMKVGKDSIVTDSIAFNFGEYFKVMEAGDSINLVSTLDINDYMGFKNPQLNVKDIIDVDLNMDIYDEYYYYVKNCMKRSTNKSNQGNISIELSKKHDDRLKYILDVLESHEKVLVFVFNYFNIKDILLGIQLRGKSILKRTSLSYNLNDKYKPNALVILPILDLIDVSSYDKIIFYDINFDIDNFISFRDRIDENKIEIIANKDDLNLNSQVLKEMLPSFDEIDIIYKSFINYGIKNFKLNSKEYIDSINKSLHMDISKIKLDLSLEVLMELKLLNFKYINREFYIKMSNNSINGVDIHKSSKLNYLYNLKKFNLTKIK